MTFHHDIVILGALLMVALCGFRDSCHAMLPQVIGLALAVIAGAWGNTRAGMEHHAKEKKSPPKDPTDAGDGK